MCHSYSVKFSNLNKIEDLYENIYWKKGATDVSSGEKTLTLKQFEYRYTPRLVRIAKQLKNSSIYDKYQQLDSSKRDNKVGTKYIEITPFDLIGNNVISFNIFQMENSFH